MASPAAGEVLSEVNHIALSYDNADSDVSALELVYRLHPKWKTDPGLVEIFRFTDGVMNTLLKITKQVPGRSKSENDKESVLLRAYGNDSDVLVDRDMEATTHALLAQRGLAAPLLARFENGLLYKFLPGRVCAARDLANEPVWRAVAVRLGEWHARLPLPNSTVRGRNRESDAVQMQGAQGIASCSPLPNIWTVIQKWVSALPTKTQDDASRKVLLQKELHRSFAELNQDHGNGHGNFILGHCDLLSANVIISQDDKSKIDGDRTSSPDSLKGKVNFIDYEYAVPCPAAFDLANHFSEWGGFECDYNMLPTRTLRRAFIEEYVESYRQFLPLDSTVSVTVERLLSEVDSYRGMPGFYWGVQALIQASISHIEFDWSSYAEVRLAEYWSWRGEVDGTRVREGTAMPLRERRWAQDA